MKEFKDEEREYDPLISNAVDVEQLRAFFVQWSFVLLKDF